MVVNMTPYVLFSELAAGDVIELDHEVKVGMQTWKTVTRGTVVSTERRRQGLHFRRNHDDKVWADVIVLRRDDGELTSVTLDEFSRLRRIGKAEAAEPAPRG